MAADAKVDHASVRDKEDVVPVAVDAGSLDSKQQQQQQQQQQQHTASFLAQASSVVSLIITNAVELVSSYGLREDARAHATVTLDSQQQHEPSPLPSISSDASAALPEPIIQGPCIQAGGSGDLSGDAAAGDLSASVSSSTSAEAAAAAAAATAAAAAAASATDRKPALSLRERMSMYTPTSSFFSTPATPPSSHVCARPQVFKRLLLKHRRSSQRHRPITCRFSCRSARAGCCRTVAGDCSDGRGIDGACSG